MRVRQRERETRRGSVQREMDRKKRRGREDREG